MTLNASAPDWTCIKRGKADQEQQKSTEIFKRGFLAASKEFQRVTTSKSSLLTAKPFHWLSPWDLDAA